MIDLNTCDKCEVKMDTNDLVWIDSEDFKPLPTDKFHLGKYKRAIKKEYSALCEDCYKKECCLK